MSAGRMPVAKTVWKSLFVGLVCLSTAAAQSSVVTYHNDNGRTGSYPAEILLSPQNVQAGMFGKRYALPLNGAVYAQPLYLSRVNVAGKGYRDVLFVATSHDSLYAFDANYQSSSNMEPLWQVDFLDSANGIGAVSGTDVNCHVIPEVGITGTPVIDPVAGTIYLIAATKESGQFVYRLHAIDVRSGAEQPGSPVVIQPDGFVAASQKQRTALLLANGIVYSTWSGYCDSGTYHGLVMAHDAATLNLVSVFDATPGDRGASFWNGGAGPSADENGHIYAVSANADFDGDAAAARYDNSVLNLTPSSLAVTDFFTPFNKLALDAADLDLGSSGALILPDEAGTAAHPHLLFTSGKEGRLYLLDRGALGGPQTGSDPGAVSSLLLPGSLQTFGMAAYFNNSIYIAPGNSPMFTFPTGIVPLIAPSAQTANTNSAPGATPSISANGVLNGIAWIVAPDSSGKLLAYDASNLNPLYDSSAQASDNLESYAEFAVPTIADGKVFAGTIYGVAVYGEIAASPPVVSGVTNSASYAANAISPGSLITLFGSALAPLSGNANETPLPVSIGDTAVTINGFAAPLLFVSPEQINIEVPWEIAPGAAELIVSTLGVPSAPVFINVLPAAPGIFAGIEGNGAVVNANGAVNSSSNPAAPGSFVSVFFTGQGPVTSAIDDGDAPLSGQAISGTLSATATVGGMPATVGFTGLAPLFPGLAQMNLTIPSLASGSYSLVIKIGDVSSNRVQIVVGP